MGRALFFRDQKRALANAEIFQSRIQHLWDKGYVIASPVNCYPAPKIGRTNRTPHILITNIPGNLSDATALSVPFGRFPEGLPRGLQLLGPPGSERELIRFARETGL